MWVPDKIKVYQDQLNFDNEILKVDPPGMVVECARDLGLDRVIVDPLPAFIGCKDNQLLYWKTDTHWTYWGACAAHKALCHAMDAVPPDDLVNRPIHSTTLALDLGSKLSPPLKEDWGGAQVLRNSKIVYKNEMVRFLEILNPTHNPSMLRETSVRFENSRQGGDERRVLLFGDSFSEYRPHLLSGLLAETFQHVLFVWSTSIDYRLVKRFRPDIVITQMAEKFIKDRPEKRIQEDGFDLASFVMTRIVDFLNSRCGNDCDPFTWSREALALMDNRYD